jgi:SAM-dependent methyltransferase
MEISDPSFDYEKLGEKYTGYRQTDPGIESYIHQALGQAKTILNVGAGAGSYEPSDRYVVAVEPSKAMRSQRILRGKVPGLIAAADQLPFDTNSFDASMALLTVHHWPDMAKGLKELRRVTKNQVLILTFDPLALDRFWNVNYFAEVVEIEKARYPRIAFIKDCLGGTSDEISIPIPLGCKDGFQEAFYGRPEAFLQKEIRMAQSAWSFLDEGIEEKRVKGLQDDLKTGGWDKKYGYLRSQPFFWGALRLLVAF